MTRDNLAFVFPGQGSQKVGMLAEMAAVTPVIEQTFAEASAALGYDLWELLQNGTQEELNLTERTQQLLLTSSVALWRVWSERTEIRPTLMAGHSLGEWSALVCAGVVDFTDAVQLVQKRGRFMQAAVPIGEGAMAAIIGLEDESIKKACAEAAAGEVVAPVNFNSPGQVVIAGAAPAVDRAIELCKQAGAKRAMLLPVSAPFHTEMMRPAAEQLAVQINATTFHVPQIPVVHNVNAATEASGEKIKSIIIEQIYSPVLWVDCVKTLSAQGVETVLECGPGKVLSGLNKRILRNLATLSVETPLEMENALAALA